MKRVFPQASEGGRVRNAASEVKGVALCAGILVLLAAGAARAGAQSPPTVAIVPLGSMDRSLLASAAQAVGSSLRVDVAVLPALPMPGSAYYRPRHRYRGDSLLDVLDRDSPPRFSHVIGVTDSDISVTSPPAYDWGVMGVARLSGRPGIVSTFRLRKDSPSRALLCTRVTKVVLHELGHTLGLPHCKTDGCLMHDAEGSIKPVDASTGHFCAKCAAHIARGLASLNAAVLPTSLGCPDPEALTPIRPGHYGLVDGLIALTP